jgi:hypothetical protein
MKKYKMTNNEAKTTPQPTPTITITYICAKMKYNNRKSID